MTKISISTVISIALCILYTIDSQAQIRNCETDEYLAHQITSNPRRIQIMENIERHTSDFQNNVNREQKVVTIPVVVHVVYKNTIENLSDEQINNQITILNQDFRRLNTNKNNRWPQADDVEIEFCLASVDPTGAATTGITRTKTTAVSFSVTSDDVKYDSKGGKNAWPAGEYLNLWVTDITGTTLGYAQFPGGSSETDGVVIDYKYFGNGSQTSLPYNLGRTATHEVGHWLNLKHIWGGGDCINDDLVNDTPMASVPHFGCQVGIASCVGASMVENYMDYSDDACMSLFTSGQKSRMLSLFSPGGARSSLTTSKGCGKPSVQKDDCVAVNLRLQYDNYPSETSWKIANISGEVVSSSSSYKGSPLYNEQMCLKEGCYTFTIYDAYGDGICCRYGNGNYALTQNENILLSGSEFKAHASYNFCVSLNKPTCSDGIQNGSETGIDCGGSCAPCKVIKEDTVVIGDKSLLTGYFESGWDGWVGGASDTYRYQGNYSYEGDYSIMLRDDSGEESAMTSPTIDITPYPYVEVSFAFYAFSMEQQEDFWLMYHDGSKWQTLTSFVSGIDFYNNQFYEVTYLLDKTKYNFNKNVQFRFQCDASSNADQVYIDAITIKGVNNNTRNNQHEVTISTKGRYLGQTQPELEIDIYPNPVDEYLYVKYDGLIISYTIYKVDGMSVVSDSKLNQEGTISVAALDSGIFMLQLVTDEGVVTTKFIKK